MRGLTALLTFLLVIYRSTHAQDFSLSSLLKDPRQNSSYYDLIVQFSRTDNSGMVLVGNVANVLLQKGIFSDTFFYELDRIKTLDRQEIEPKWDFISKYKLIYYSPQILPSAAYEKSTTPINGRDEELSPIPNEPIFSVGEKNGSIYLHIPPNEPILEYLCVSKLYCSCLSCIFSLNVIYTSGNRISAESVRVFIDDYNDFAPKFYSKNEIAVNISESSRIGDSFRVANAAAFDSDAYYNKITYQMSDDTEGETRSNLFDVTPIDAAGRDLTMILKSHLDYEIKREYELYLIARDNGPNGGQSSWIRVRVRVLDENDNSPVCEKSLFMESVRENSLVENFMQIRVTDIDSGLNTRFIFNILDSEENQRFKINTNTGWLSVRKVDSKELDYESKAYHELIIRIDDVSVRNNFTTYCSARVNVVDVNDNPAKLKVIKYLNESVQAGFYSLNTLSDTSTKPTTDSSDQPYSYSNTQIEIVENNSPHTVLALIRVFDRDSISNYRFSIQSATNSHEDTTMFEIRFSDRVNREFELIATAAFNAELIQNYRLKIVLYDLDTDAEISKPGFTYSAESLMFTRKPLVGSLDYYKNNFQVVLYQHVRILDLNDNKPEFVKKSYQFFIEENLSNTSLRVPPIEVYDVDTSERNSRLRFRLGEPSRMSPRTSSVSIREHLFVLDTEANYPLLHVIKPFDFETHGDKVEFELIAYDVDNFTDSCQVTIFIRDSNDNAPIFMNDNATFVIRENSPPNSFIGQVIAIDRDSAGPNSEVSFRIQSEPLRAYFKIYKTGVISNWVPLDREAHSEFTIYVEAFNPNAASLSRVGVYYVKMEDENDNRPRFIYPRENSTRLILKLPLFDSFPNSTNLIRIFDAKAVDEDFGDNGRVVYSIDTISSPAPNSFLIDKSNGSVYFNFFAFNITDLDQLSRFRGTFRLMLTARDSAPSQPLSATPLNLTLYLNYDLSELAAEFPASSSILRSTAMTADLDEFGLLSIGEFEGRSEAKNFFQIVSNGVLLVILITVLMFMMLVACFLFVIFYKKNSGVDAVEKSKSEFKSSVEKSGTSELDNKTLSSYLGRVKNGLKIKQTLVKSSSYQSHTTIGPRKNDENLTVKDASPNETTVEPMIGNSFKVTIKSSDPTKNQSKFVFDNLMAKVNHHNDLVIEKPSPPAIATDTNITPTSMTGCGSNSSDMSYSNDENLCINDFSRHHHHLGSKKHPNISFTNSNNSTIILNSLSPTSSSSLSNTPLRGSYNPGFVDSKARPSTASSSHLSTSNTIKFILSSQLAANQRDPNSSLTTRPATNSSSVNNTEDMLQNLLEKFERFYNNSVDSSLNIPTMSRQTFERH